MHPGVRPVRRAGEAHAFRWGLVCVLLAVVALIPGARVRAGEAPALSVVVNEGVPVTSLDADELASIFLRHARNWKDGTPVRPLNLPTGTPERVEFDRRVLHMEPDQSAQYWVDRMVRGEEAAPKAVAKPEIILRLVQNTPGAIGYVPSDCVDAKSRVVARIARGKIVAP